MFLTKSTCKCNVASDWSISSSSAPTTRQQRRTLRRSSTPPSCPDAACGSMTACQSAVCRGAAPPSAWEDPAGRGPGERSAPALYICLQLSSSCFSTSLSYVLFCFLLLLGDVEVPALQAALPVLLRLSPPELSWKNEQQPPQRRLRCLPAVVPAGRVLCAGEHAAGFLLGYDSS